MVGEMHERKTLVVLGGGLIKDTETGKWRTCQFGEGDEYGMTNDRWRVEAAIYLFKNDQCSRIVVSGGAGQLKFCADPNIPTVGAVMKEELIEAGIPEQSIIGEFNSDTTYQQLCNLIKFGENNTVNLNDVVLLGQEWHIGRVYATICWHDELRKALVKVPIIAAEDILLKYDLARWEKIIETSRQHQSMKERVLKEYGGIRQIVLGTYRFR